jgi:hypothetical protein
LPLRIRYRPAPQIETKVFPDVKYNWVPIIPVRIVDQKLQVKTNQFFAVVDTGSDNCLFHADALKPFNIKLEDGIKGRNLGGVGKQISIPVYYHDVRVLFALDHIISIRAGFSEELAVAGILGRNGFFDKYSVTFDHTDEPPCMTLEKIVRKKLN